MRSRSAVLAVSSLLCCVLAACHHDATRPEPPVPTTITLQSADGDLDAIGVTAQLTAAVLDQRGEAITNPAVTWQSADEGVASVSTTGLVTAVANGTSQITATAGSVQAHVSVTVQQAASAITAISGDQQSGDTGQPLAQPLVVQVNDRLAHPVAGVQVEFHAAAGNGTVAPASATTDASGQAQTVWTTGGTAGVQHVNVVVAGLDSISFSASVQTSGTPSPLVVAPDTLVDAQTMTLTGVTFSTTPADNVVTIDGVSATVSGATATSLTVQVPHFACQPARTVTVSVTVGAQAAVTTQAPLRPAAFTTLAVGEEAIVQDPAQFCLQFTPSASGTHSYLIGLSAPAEIPGAVLPFQITARTGASIGTLASADPVFGAGPTPLVRASRVARSTSAGVGPRLSLDRWRGREQAEAKLRHWEASRLPALAARAHHRMPIATDVRALTSGATHVVGDTLTIRVPDASSTDPCTVFTTIHAIVRVIGTAGIWVQDVDNPTTDSLTLADIQTASDQFDNIIYATDTTYFGHPSDVDANGHVIVVLTWQVNKAPRILGFVFGGDLFPGDATCPESNGGELYYGQVPDPTNIAGTGARTKADVVAQTPDLIAHEFTHIIQNSQRAVLNSGVFMSGWAAEGQATFAEELVGDAVLGNTSAQNYGADVAFSSTGFDWYAPAIQKLMAYFGDLGANNQAANAPDLCTVYGNLQLTAVPCDAAAFYGASWSLQRYIGDQYGPGYTGGLSQLTRDWVSKNVTMSGTANIAALLGVNYDTLFVRYATALALDDQANSTGTAWVPPQFSITSWNSSNLAAFVNTKGFGWLAPSVMAFAPTTASRSVRGGSTAYTELTTTGAHPATALQLTDLAGKPLSTALRPALWVVRIE